MISRPGAAHSCRLCFTLHYRSRPASFLWTPLAPEFKFFGAL